VGLQWKMISQGEQSKVKLEEQIKKGVNGKKTTYELSPSSPTNDHDGYPDAKFLNQIDF